MSRLEYFSDRPLGKELQALLARANEFTMGDLEENRQGKISNRQVWRLWGKAGRATGFCAVIVVGWMAIVAMRYGTIPGFPVPSMIGGDEAALNWLVFGATVGCGAAMFLGLAQMRESPVGLLMDLASGRAAVFEGRVTKREERVEVPRNRRRRWGDEYDDEDGTPATEPRYHYAALNEYFEVSEAGYQALEEWTNYRLYYAPHSKVLLSIEPV